MVCSVSVFIFLPLCIYVFFVCMFLCTCECETILHPLAVSLKQGITITSSFTSSCHTHPSPLHATLTLHLLMPHSPFISSCHTHLSSLHATLSLVRNSIFFHHNMLIDLGPESPGANPKSSKAFDWLMMRGYSKQDGGLPGKKRIFYCFDWARCLFITGVS